MKKNFQVFFSNRECISRNRKFKSLVPQALFLANWNSTIFIASIYRVIAL